jgi:hypothetical protein
MKPNKIVRFMGLLLTLLTALSLLAACSGQAVQPTQTTGETGGAAATETTGLGTGTEAPAVAQTAELPSTGGTAVPTGAYAPPAGDVCQKMADDVQATLGVEQTAVKVENSAPFTDPNTNDTGTGCQITITAKGSELAEAASLADVTGGLNVVLQSAGWDVDQAFAVEDNNSSTFAFRQGNILALVNANVEAAPEASCPADQPIADCNADPELLTYTVTVNLSERG